MTKKLKRVSGLFIAPSFAGVLTFFLVPFFVVIYYSLVDNPVNKEFVAFDNFVDVWTNKAFVLAVSNTVKFSIVSVPLVVALSLIVAFALDSNVGAKSKIRSCLLSPMMVPIASVILIWQVLFHFNGVVNEICSRFDISKVDSSKGETFRITKDNEDGSTEVVCRLKCSKEDAYSVFTLIIKDQQKEYRKAGGRIKWRVIRLFDSENNQQIAQES